MIIQQEICLKVNQAISRIYSVPRCMSRNDEYDEHRFLFSSINVFVVKATIYIRTQDEVDSMSDSNVIHVLQPASMIPLTQHLTLQGIESLPRHRKSRPSELFILENLHCSSFLIEQVSCPVEFHQ